MAAVDANPSYFSVSVTSSLSDFGSQKRFPASVTIGELKVIQTAVFPLNAHCCKIMPLSVLMCDTLGGVCVCVGGGGG